LAALIAVLSGCSLAPIYERSALPTAAAYPGAFAAQTRVTQDALQFGWREFFSDSRLRELIAQALENNRDLRIAVQRVEEVRGLYGIQRADRLPGISMGATGSRSRVPFDLSPTGSSITSDQYQVTMNLSLWELDFWGRVRNLTEAALETYLGTEEAQRAIVISLVAQVANTYLLERELDERIVIGEQTLAIREESYRIARRRYEVGYASKLDAVQAETLLNQARADLASLKRLRDQNLNALTLLVGTPIIAFENQPLSMIGPGYMQEISARLPSDLLINRPDILAAEHRLKAANANIGAARAAFFPRISLTSTLGTASTELSNLFHSGTRTWSFVPQILMPIFDARLWSAYDVTKVEKEIGLTQYEKAIQTAFREVADALAVHGTVDHQLSAQQSLVDAVARTYRLSTLRYERGIDSYLGVLDAQRSLYAAQQGLISLRLGKLVNLVRLYAVLGGGAV